MAMESYHPSLTVDNCYTRAQARVGGILSGASRRFNARNRHAAVRSLAREGLSRRRISAEVGYNVSTVSRILSGVIRTCLTRAETLASGPLKRVLRELTNTPVVQGATHRKPSRKPAQRRRKRWNYFKGKWGDRFRAKFGAAQHNLFEQSSWPGKERGYCPWCLRTLGRQVCPCCGLALPRPRAALQARCGTSGPPKT